LWRIRDSDISRSNSRWMRLPGISGGINSSTLSFIQKYLPGSSGGVLHVRDENPKRGIQVIELAARQSPDRIRQKFHVRSRCFE